MKRALFNVRPVVISIIIACGLGVVLWQQLGVPYSAIYTDPTTRLAYLFLDKLMPGLIAIAASCGLIAGAMESGGKLKSAKVRGTVAAALFSAIAFPIYGFITQTSSVYIPYILVILQVVIFALIGLIGGAFYIPLAAGFAEIGERLRKRSKSLIVSIIILACCVALGLPIAQGSSLRKDIEFFTRAMSKAQPYVEKNIIDLPENCQWKPYRMPILHKNISAKCDITDGTLNLTLDADSKIKSARVYFRLPEGVHLETKDASLAYLHNHGVHKNLVRELKKNARGLWESTDGSQGLIINNWQPVD